MPSSRRNAEHRLRHVLVLQGQELAAALHDGHPAAEPAEHLPELEPDVAAAQHDEVLGHPVQLHDRGRVERGHPVEPLDVGRGRPAAGVDEDQLRLEHPPIHRHLARARESGLGADQVEALGGLEPAQASGAEALDDGALTLADPAMSTPIGPVVTP